MKTSGRSLLGLLLLVLLVDGGNRWWVARSEQALGRQVAALAQAGDIRMISSEHCAICLEARVWLTQNRVPFGECVIERDSACRAEHQSLGAQGTPVMVVRGQPQLGFNAERLRQTLQRGATSPGA